MKYCNTDCKPLPTYTKKQIFELELEYNRKLKASGFQDIEKWSTSKRKVKRLQFIRGHTRWFIYKTKRKFLELKNESFNYYRVLGLFANHAPTDPILEQYREIIKEYAMSGCLSKAVRKINPTINRKSVCTYINTNLKKMILFVNKEFGND